MVVSGLVPCLLEPRLEAEEAGNPAMPIGTDKERPQEKSALSMQRTRERAAFLNRKLWDNEILLQPNSTENAVFSIPIQASRGQVESLDLHPHQPVKGILTPPPGNAEKAVYQSRSFSFMARNEHLHPSQRRPHEEPGPTSTSAPPNLGGIRRGLVEIPDFHHRAAAIMLPSARC